MPTIAKKKDYLEFANKGEVPINAFKLLGASSKRDDTTKIGYFGTGLKYALAVLIREGIGFKVYSGEKEIKIGTRKTKFLEREITVITVNGEKTSITVEAGINWEPWFAIREIYSNNLDENGEMKLVESIEPEQGTTKIYIQRNEKLDSFIDNWGMYFSNTRSILSTWDNSYAVLHKNNHKFLTVFRRGIQAYISRNESLFDYDVTRLRINESRVAEHDHEARQRCAEALALSNSKEVIQKFLDCDTEKYIEKDANFWQYLFDDDPTNSYVFNRAWYEVLKDKRIVPTEYGGFYGVTKDTVLLPQTLCQKLYSHFGDELTIVGKSKEAYIILENANIDFVKEPMTQLENVGFGYPMEKVRLVRFKDDDILGMADNGLVLLSEKLTTTIHEGHVLETLFEEVAHAKTGYSDNTRAFQHYIIAIACSLIKSRKKVEK